MLYPAVFVIVSETKSVFRCLLLQIGGAPPNGLRSAPARIVLYPAVFVGSSETKSVFRSILLQIGGARSGCGEDQSFRTHTFPELVEGRANRDPSTSSGNVLFSKPGQQGLGFGGAEGAGGDFGEDLLAGQGGRGLRVVTEAELAEQLGEP